jgi:hypothetical protein
MYFVISAFSYHVLFATQIVVKFVLKRLFMKEREFVCRRDGPAAAHREPRPSQDREGRPPREQGQRTRTALPPPQRLQADTYIRQLIQSSIRRKKTSLCERSQLAVLWIQISIRIRIGFGFSGVPGSVSGFTIQIRIQEGKNGTVPY